MTEPRPTFEHEIAGLTASTHGVSPAAVNAYSELRDALADCLVYIERCEEDHGVTTCGNRARAALALTETKT